ncbi:MAG: hypothetical protein ACJ07L_09905 [Opitutales bacterium]
MSGFVEGEQFEVAEDDGGVRSVALVLREMKEELFTVAFDGTFVSF